MECNRDDSLSTKMMVSQVHHDFQYILSSILEPKQESDDENYSNYELL